MSRRVRILIATAVLLALGGGGAALLLARGGETREEPSVAVKRGPLEVVLAETGTIEPLSKVEVKSKIAGQVAKLYVDVGARVTAGQLLLQLDTSEMARQRAQAQADRDMARARLDRLIAGARPEERAQAEAQLARAQAAFDRTELEHRRSEAALAAGTIAPAEAEAARYNHQESRARLAEARAQLAMLRAGSRREDLAEARAQLARSQAALDAAEDQLGYAGIRSPISGTVIRRGIEVGEMVSPGVSATAQGTSMLTIANLDQLLVVSRLNQIDVGKVALGQPVDVRVDSAPGRVLRGKLRKIAPAAEAGKADESSVQAFAIETILLDGDRALMRPGMSAEIDIHAASKADALYLPVEAVVRGKGDQATVTLPPKAKNTEPEVKKVTIGLVNDHHVEIRKGLKEGDTVLVKPASAADNSVKF